MSDNIVETRVKYADDVARTAQVTSPAIKKAFATVLREDFLGPGPWKLKTVEGKYFDSESSDPKVLYQDLLVAIDQSRYLNNGVPSFLAGIMQSLNLQKGDNVLHIGAGVGYYSAILSEVVGATGHVRAVEVDSDLYARAVKNLAKWPNVTAENSDTSFVPENTYDDILVNAGATHIQLKWLKGLKDGGRIVMPLTYDTWERGQLLLVKRNGKTFDAKMVGTVVIYPCIGSRDDVHAERLKNTVKKKGWNFEGIVRFDPENADNTCWLKDDNYWLSQKH